MCYISVLFLKADVCFIKKQSCIENIEKGEEMEIPKILEKYGKLYLIIQVVGEIPLNEDPTIDSLKVSRAILQMVYRGIKEEDFKGSALDFICWVSTQYILIEWEKRIEDGIDSLLIVWHFNQKVFRNMIRLFIKNPDYIFETDTFKKFGDKWLLGKLFNAIRLSELYPNEFPNDLKGISAMLKT